MHNSTCAFYKGLIHLMGLRSTQHKDEEYVQMEQEKILIACLWEKLQGAWEVGWGVFLSWGLFCVLSADWWRQAVTPATTHNSLPHTHTFLPIVQSSPLDVRVKGEHSHQLLPLSCAFWEETVLLPPCVLERGGSGTRFLTFCAHGHACALAVKQDSNTCCVLLFLSHISRGSYK